jgi:hypothetical protein
MAIAIGVGIFLFFDFIVVTTLIRALLAPLCELAKQFPAREPAPHAGRRDFQSFSIGALNAGWGFHVAVDDQFFHLSPARMERFFRVQPLSIPWTHIRLLKRGTRTTKVRIEGATEKPEIKGPTWCLERAA